MQPSQTAYVILGMLSIHPNQSGYHIRKGIEGSVGYFWSESYGQIYPTIKRLAAEGLIAACPSTSPGGRHRREYSITAAGQACLQEWLALPYRDHPPRDEFLLKLFFGREVPPSVSVGHIRDFQERNRRLLATVLEQEAIARTRHSAHPHFPYWMLTLSYGVAQLRSAVDWSESALAMLSPRSG